MQLPDNGELALHEAPSATNLGRLQLYVHSTATADIGIQFLPALGTGAYAPVGQVGTLPIPSSSCKAESDRLSAWTCCTAHTWPRYLVR